MGEWNATLDNQAIAAIPRFTPLFVQGGQVVRIEQIGGLRMILAGEPGLLQEAILRVLNANAGAWDIVFVRLDQGREPREAAVQTVEEVAQLSAWLTERVRQVLHLVAARDDQLEDRLRRGTSSDEECRIVVALSVHCRAKDPFLPK